MALAGNTLPQVSTGGTVTMNLHQVNADGAGPMTCSVDPTAGGDKFEDMTITTNVPGNNGRSNAANADFPLVAKMPAGVSCTGTVAGVQNVCMVKCQNPSGPFGGTVAVQTGNGAGTANSGTANSGTNSNSTANDAGTGTAAGTAGSKNGTSDGGGAAGKSSNGTTGKKEHHRKGHKKGGNENGKAGNAVRAMTLLFGRRDG